MLGTEETGESQQQADELKQHSKHLSAAMHALQSILGAQPQLSAIIASIAALAPISLIQIILMQRCQMQMRLSFRTRQISSKSTGSNQQLSSNVGRLNDVLVFDV